MRYLPLSDSDRQEMLRACGLSSQEELFAHLPEAVRLKKPIRLPPGKSEFEVIEYLKSLASKNKAGWPCFLGAGAYYHFRPALVDAIVSRGEFLTAYTPYQPEISQGILMATFEFQTMICQLTGMEVANASMYDGSTATAEAGLMAVRITGRPRVVVSQALHPEYRQVLETYFHRQSLHVDTIPYDRESGRTDAGALEGLLTEDTAAVIVQSPNFFGVVEELQQLADLAHRHGALFVVVFNEAVSLGLLRPPVEADIVAGELQSFAMSPSFGGPFAGVIATKKQYIRQIPGRLVGQTNDVQGRRAFCLTLATREQHIRRAKATSNICTNQALVALMATIFMSVYGRRGLRELAEQNLSKAHYLASKLPLRFTGPFFNEFVVRVPGRSPMEVNRALLDKQIIGGLPLGRFYPELGDCLLLCATEMAHREHMDIVAEEILK